MKPDTAIGMVSGGTLTTATLKSLLDVLRLRPRLGGGFLLVEGGPALAYHRSRLAAAFLETDNEYMLSLDTDILFTPEDVDALYAAHADVALGTYPNDNGGPVLGGAGFVLIRRRVFTKLGREAYHVPDFGVSEDIAFLRNAQAAGFSIRDKVVKVGHVKQTVLTFND
jgi:hypothetical protein